MARLDERLAGWRFVCGEQFSITDITAFCALYFGRLVDLEIPAHLANLQRWHDEVSSRPSAAA